ncbi:recombining binding protein suppressor of hairless-like protein [Stigmatopora argus]
MRDLLPAGTAGGDVGAYMCLDSAAQTHSDAYKLHFESLPNTTGMTACAKSLFISDADKRKHFRLLLGLFLEVGGGRQEAGSFHSRLIKVISKPSQKRQSMKNAELCISARSRIALFNRLRSQTVSTRYLAVEGGAFVASARHWTAFAITLVEEHGGDFVLSEGLVCYGSVVQLVCTESGLALPPMVLRKVNKQHAITCVDEPVCQLHKCALEMRDTPRAFLAVSNDAIVLHQAAWGARDSGRVLLNDGSCWTVTGAEVVEFAFRPGDTDDDDLPTCVRTPLTPFPNVTGLELNGGGGHVATLELEGENLGPHLQVCFGSRRAHTVFKSAKSLVCVVPDVCALREGGAFAGALTVPISLRRLCDGVAYRTAYSFTYTPEPAPLEDNDGGNGGGGGGRAGPPGVEDDALLQSIHHEFTRTNFHLLAQP